MPKNKEKINHRIRKTRALSNQRETLEMLASPPMSIKILFKKLDELKEHNEQLEKRIKILEKQLGSKKILEKKALAPITNATEDSFGSRIARLELE